MNKGKKDLPAYFFKLRRTMLRRAEMQSLRESAKPIVSWIS